jgi:hypothetical protein
MEERLDQTPLAVVKLAGAGDKALAEDRLRHLVRAPLDEGLLVGCDDSLHELGRRHQIAPMDPELEGNQRALATEAREKRERIALEGDRVADGRCQPAGRQRLTSTR